jgi:transposase
MKKVVSKLTNKKYILMDNARIHHSKIVKEYMKTIEHEIIYNVPYSPENNPIELVFSKFKSIIRNKDNSTVNKMMKNITISFNKITKTDLMNFYNYSIPK